MLFLLTTTIISVIIKIVQEMNYLLHSVASQQKERQNMKTTKTATATKTTATAKTATKETTTVLVNVEELKRAITELKLDNKFKVIYNDNNEVQQIADIHLINSDKTLSSLACFRIGFRKTAYRFSSNRHFNACEFLKNEHIDKHKRYEVTLKDYNALKTALKQACDDYTKRYNSKATATKENKQEQKKEA